MAPEYIVCGKLTKEADVYSFGVLAIEVICGAKNTDSFPILEKVHPWFSIHSVNLCVFGLSGPIF